MKVSYEEFYLLSQSEKNIRGTLHVKILHHSLIIDIRGIHVVGHIGKEFRFILPAKTVYDVDAKKNVSFPVFDIQREMKERIIEDMQENGEEFILERLEDGPKKIKKVKFEVKKPKKPLRKKAVKKPEKKWKFKKTRRTW